MIHPPDVAKEESYWNSPVAGEGTPDTIILEEDLEGSYKTKHMLILSASHSISVFTLQNEIFCSLKICTMFTAALFIVAQWETASLSIDCRWINTLWYMHTWQ